MNSLENKLIETEIVIINLRGYRFTITDRSIVRTGIQGSEESAGVLVSTHFEPVFGVLYLAHLLKDGEVKEAMDQWYMDDRKKYEEAPELGKVLDALLKQLSLLTDGAYEEYYEDCRIRHDGLDEDVGHGSRTFNLPYVMRMQDIFWHILDLKEGRYYGSENPRFEGRRRIPRIETVGERLYCQLLDLIWRMDNGEGYREPAEIEAKKRDEEWMNKIIPPVRER
ncbi:MAG: hypothetical protein IJ088_02380 [Clostridia bacterium]|nr:hypothetical protein [Clostridia bacterium]